MPSTVARLAGIFERREQTKDWAINAVFRGKKRESEVETIDQILPRLPSRYKGSHRLGPLIAC